VIGVNQAPRDIPFDEQLDLDALARAALQSNKLS
jgi:hypothetical protein